MNQKSKFVSLAELQKAKGMQTEPKDRRQGVVYVSGTGRVCPQCGHPKNACECRQQSRAEALAENHPSGPVRVSRETKGRKGKGVTLVTGLPLQGDELKALAKQLKQVCGTGGTVKEDRVEIQGDHRDKLVKLLVDLGYDAKKSGG